MLSFQAHDYVWQLAMPLLQSQHLRCDPRRHTFDDSFTRLAVRTAQPYTNELPRHNPAHHKHCTSWSTGVALKHDGKSTSPRAHGLSLETRLDATETSCRFYTFFCSEHSLSSSSSSGFVGFAGMLPGYDANRRNSLCRVTPGVRRSHGALI